MTKSDSNVLMISIKQNMEEIEIKEESFEDNPLELQSDNEEKSEDEVWVEERTEIPLVKVEPEDPLPSDEISEDEVWVEENPEITLVKVEPEDPLQVISPTLCQSYFTFADYLQPRAKKLKSGKSREDMKLIRDMEEQMRVTESQTACASGLSRVTRRAVKRELGLEQELPLVRGIKREASPSPSTSPNPYRDAVGAGELSAMRQLLSTLQRPVDDDEVFGAHVASELRALRRPHLKRKLKRLVQEAILAVSKEDDD